MNMEGKQKAAEILRTVRRANDLTQRALARLARVPQPTIAAIESARREPSLSLLSRIVESAGYGIQLDLVPLARFGAVNTAGRIERALLEDQEPYRVEDSVLRLVLSFRDAIRHVDNDALRDLIDEPPSLSGSSRWDAFLAAVVEDECARRSVSTPRWVNDPARVLKPFWYLSNNPALHDWEFTTVPAAFMRHGVLVAAEELASV
jgi:transcriptional regulator with XRE-family HTH domain